MLGIEIVQSKASKAPAPAAAAHIKEAMLGLRVLMTVDGPNANVLKIKPPMVFGEPDADRMLAVLTQVGQSGCQACHASKAYLQASSRGFTSMLHLPLVACIAADVGACSMRPCGMT